MDRQSPPPPPTRTTPFGLVVSASPFFVWLTTFSAFLVAQFGRNCYLVHSLADGTKLSCRYLQCLKMKCVCSSLNVARETYRIVVEQACSASSSRVMCCPWHCVVLPAETFVPCQSRDKRAKQFSKLFTYGDFGYITDSFCKKCGKSSDTQALVANCILV